MYVNPESLEDSGPFSDRLDSCFGGHLNKEFLHFICGPRLGHGISREVFACRIREDCVVKFEPEHGHFANVQEAIAWNLVADDPEVSRWLAPVVAISACGRILLQKRTTKAHPSQYPDRIPSFLTDQKYENFGMYKGRLVSHDYALNRMASLGDTNRTMKAHWT